MGVVIVVIIVIVILIFVFGGMDNNRPVKDWTTEKLIRMHPKLLAANQLDKAKEVLEEVERREEQKRADEVVNQMPLPTNDEMAMMEAMANNNMKLLVKTMDENSCSEDEAKVIVSNKINELEAKYKADGSNDEEATEKALRELGIL